MLDRDTLNYLYTLRRRGIKIGLHRTKALLSRCGNPHKDIPVIHIAGTNGKGSTAAMIASILRQTGRSVGLYTSPHLVRFNERVRINGVPITDERIEEFMKTYRKDIDTLGSTFFEATTALTFSHFSREEVHMAVVEVGMGGRLDSSNVANSVLSVLTPIDYDHTEFLGHDLESIAQEKCGILRQNVPVVVAPQHSQVTGVIQRSASNLGTDIFFSSEVVPIDQITLERSKSKFRTEDVEFTVPLLGRHQVTNAQTAISACRLFDRSTETAHIRRGLEHVTWPGRLQKLSDDPLIYYDVAHNPHGLTAVLNTLRELFGGMSVAALCAMKKRKQVETMGKLLKQYCRLVVTTTSDHGDFFTADALAKKLSRWGVDAIPASTISEALRFCRDDSVDCDLWLIFGTHYIAEAVFEEFHFSFDKGVI